MRAGQYLILWQAASQASSWESCVLCFLVFVSRTLDTPFVWRGVRCVDELDTLFLT